MLLFKFKEVLQPSNCFVTVFFFSPWLFGLRVTCHRQAAALLRCPRLMRQGQPDNCIADKFRDTNRAVKIHEACVIICLHSQMIFFYFFYMI